MCDAFFMRVRPASRKAKPACMNITSTAVTTTQIVLAAISRSWFLGTDLHLPEFPSGPVVADALDRRRPDDPVTRLVTGAGRVDDRAHHSLRPVGGDDEDEHCLRQEPRLEDPAAVLVRDSALLAVADGLDHRHAHVSGRLLDRVDDGLDALPDDDGFNLDHALLLAVEVEG